MIQMDFIWSYAIGATFAIAVSRQIQKEEGKWYESKYFVITFFYLAIFFAPIVLSVLHAHTSWETMQVYSSINDIPTLFIIIYSITNILDGLFAYYVCQRFIKQGDFFKAGLQAVFGYFLMFFIIFHGWDGWGFDRFFYDPSMNNDIAWKPGAGDLSLFAFSNVAIYNYIMGAILLPPMIYFAVKWLRVGLIEDSSIPNEKVPSAIKSTILFLIIFLGISLSLAIGATFTCKFFTLITGGNQMTSFGEISFLGILIGLPLFIILTWFFLLRRGKLFSKLLSILLIEDSNIKLT